MKILLVLSLFLSSLYSSEIILDKPLENKIYTGKNNLVFIDKQNKYTLENIATIKDQFKTIDKVNIGYTKDPIWNYFQIKNNTNQTQTLILKNQYSNIFYIDILIVKNNKIKQHHLGCLRKKELKEIPYRSSVFKLELSPKESAQIYIKYISNNTINIEWEISSLENFFNESFFQTIFFGLFAGIVFTLIFYTFSLYKIFKDISLIYYILFAFGNLILFFSLNGIIYMLDIGLSPLMAISISGVFNFFPILMMALFMIHFFHLKQHSKLVYFMVFITVPISILVMILDLPVFFQQDPWIHSGLSNGLMVLSYIIFFITSIFAIQKKLIGSWYFLAASSSYLLVFIIGILFITGIIHIHTEPIYYFLIAVVADLIFLSLAIYQKIYYLKDQKDKAEHLLLEHARFKNTGLMIAEVIHQLKSPITQLSSIANHISMIFDNKKEHFNNKELQVAHKLEQNIIFTAESINQLYGSYNSNNHSKTLTNIDDSIKQVLDLFSSKLKKFNIKTIYKSQDSIHNIDAYALQQILLIIIDNAISIIDERDIQNPYISISLIIEKNKIKIKIADNAKGIESQYIDSIFNIYETHKQNKGLGIGLALAKSLAKENLNGDIKVKNIDDGACFTLTLNLQD